MRKLLLILAIMFLFPARTWAYNYLYVHPTTGLPLRWDNTQTIKYWVDPGPLGRLTNAQALTLVQEAMKIWEAASLNGNVPKFEFAGFLPEDVDGTNYDSYVSRYTCYTDNLDACSTESQKNLQTVIVFDEDQSFLNKLCITNCGFAIAGARVFSGSQADAGFIRQGILVLGAASGDPNTRVSANVGRIAHEIGHLLGLAHTSINEEAYIDDLTGYESLVPTMFYSFSPKSQIDKQATLVTLNPDDIAGISALYPSTTLVTDTATIKGNILKSDGSPMMHVNVIARNIDDPLCEAYSWLSGRLCHPGSSGGLTCFADANDPSRMEFEIRGIPPGTYTLEVEEVADDGLGQTLAPGLLPSEDIFGDAEFWNEGDAAGDPSNLTSSTITLAPGETRDNVDIILNRSEVTPDRIKYIPLDTFTPGPGTRCPTEPPVDYAGMIGIDETPAATGTPGGSGSSSGGCSLIP